MERSLPVAKRNGLDRRKDVASDAILILLLGYFIATIALSAEFLGGGDWSSALASIVVEYVGIADRWESDVRRELASLFPVWVGWVVVGFCGWICLRSDRHKWFWLAVIILPATLLVLTAIGDLEVTLCGCQTCPVFSCDEDCHRAGCRTNWSGISWVAAKVIAIPTLTVLGTLLGRALLVCVALRRR
jgi:hypothetical protein